MDHLKDAPRQFPPEQIERVGGEGTNAMAKVRVWDRHALVWKLVAPVDASEGIAVGTYVLEGPEPALPKP